MKRTPNAAPFALLVPLLAVACTNPTIDPAADFRVEGRALKTNGDALAHADVKLVRFFHPTKLFRPSPDDLFSCNNQNCGYSDLDLEIALVTAVRTDGQGYFDMAFKGADIAGQGGVTDSTGQVEGSNLVIVLVDPDDPDAYAGVFTNDHTFVNTDVSWDTGNLRLWAAEARADVTTAINSGQIKMTWKKVSRETGSSVDNTYRIEVRSSRNKLVLYCEDGISMVENGGCISSGDSLEFSVSAWSVYNYYSDQGQFRAYIQGENSRYRFRSKFMISESLPNPQAGRAPINPSSLSTSPPERQRLDGTLATDGDPAKRVSLTGSPRAIYAQLPAGAADITDAGLLNALVSDAQSACVVVEFSSTNHSNLDAAHDATDWQPKGKFCGSQGAKNEMSAVVSFNTSNASGQRAAWMRFRLEADGMGSPYFQEIGEIVVLSKK